MVLSDVVADHPWMCYTVAMKKVDADRVKVPFVKRMATIVFEANVPHKGSKVPIGIADFRLCEGDMGIYDSLLKAFFRAGEPIVSKSAQDVADIMPQATFMEALPRLVKAGSISVTFWEHHASAPKFWRKVKSF